MASYAPDYNSDFPDHIVSKLFEIKLMNPCDESMIPPISSLYVFDVWVY